MSSPAVAGREPCEPRWVAAADGVLDGGVVAFAAWTLWYELALWRQWSLWGAAAVWLVVALGVVGWAVAVHLRRAGGPPRAGVVRAREGRPPVAGYAVAAVVLAGLVAAEPGVGVVPLAAGGLLVLAVAMLSQRLASYIYLV